MYFQQILYLLEANKHYGYGMVMVMVVHLAPTDDLSRWQSC